MYLEPALLDGCDLRAEEFSSPMLGRLYAAVREKAREHAVLSPAVLSGSFSQEEMQHITALLQKPEPADNPGRKKALADCIGIIREEQDKHAAGDDLRAWSEKIRNKKGYGG